MSCRDPLKQIESSGKVEDTTHGALYAQTYIPCMRDNLKHVLGLMIRHKQVGTTWCLTTILCKLLASVKIQDEHTLGMEVAMFKMTHTSEVWHAHPCSALDSFSSSEKAL